MVLEGKDILSKPCCPKCGSRNVSKITMPALGKDSRPGKSGKQYPEPYWDDPPDYHLPPMLDFNHTHHCNACGYFFGGSWGGVL